jgi:hypothetical protein
MGSGKGMPAGVAAMLGLQYGGSRLGRIVDRMRAGAPMRRAISAPSPSEAAQQMGEIQKYYG